jgi:starch phosphorylase
MPQFQGRVVFIENYDMNVGRRLTSGSDVWLNTPRRPNEASGTSGMKVPLNGGLNCSILDGWWPEAYRDNPLSGWALGSEIEYADSERQDAADAEAIYQTIETEIVPMFYDRGPDGIPSRWLKRVRESMKACAAQFSTHRMVADYTTMFYAGAAVRSEILSTDSYKRARDNARWKEELRRDWPNINVWARVEGASGSGGSIRVSEKMEVVAEVDLGPIDPNNVEVQLYLAPLQADPNGRVQRAGCIAMRPDGKSSGGHHVYRGSLLEGDSGEFGYTVRVVPKHPDLVHPHELGLVRWARAH